MSKPDLTLKPEATRARRLEVITGTGRRRLFSADDKARMIEETLVPGAVVSEVARRHGLSPQQFFTWRRQARQPAGADAATEAPQFVPAVIDSALPEGAVQRHVNRTLATPVHHVPAAVYAPPQLWMSPTQTLKIQEDSRQRQSISCE